MKRDDAGCCSVVQGGTSRRVLLSGVFLLLFLLGGAAYGQSREPTFGPLVGLHVGEHLFLEGGVGLCSISSPAHGFLIMKGLTISAEVKPGETVIVAPRATAWMTGVFALGLGAGYYTDFDNGTLMVQPELGVGFAGGRITWRINFPLGKEIDGVNTSELNISAFIPML